MLYLLGGTNRFASWEELIRLKKRYRQENPDSVVDVFDAGDSIKQGSLSNDIQGISLFSAKRLIILKRLHSLKKDDRELLTSLLEKSYSSLDIIIWEDENIDKRQKIYKFISKKGIVNEFNPLKPIQIKAWIQKVCVSKNLQCSQSASEELILRLGNDQFALSNAIETLSLHADAQHRKEIQLKDVSALVSSTVETDVWKLMDSIGNTKIAQAITDIDNFIKDNKGYSIFISLIARQLRLMLLAKIMIGRGKGMPEIQAQLKLPPFIVRKVIDQSQRFHIEHLKMIYKKLVDTDIAVKSGLMNQRLAGDLFLSLFI